jgi:hypothetical protein
MLIKILPKSLFAVDNELPPAGPQFSASQPTLWQVVTIHTIIDHVHILSQSRTFLQAHAAAMAAINAHFSPRQIGGFSSNPSMRGSTGQPDQSSQPSTSFSGQPSASYSGQPFGSATATRFASQNLPPARITCVWT